MDGALVALSACLAAVAVLAVVALVLVLVAQRRLRRDLHDCRSRLEELRLPTTSVAGSEVVSTSSTTGGEAAASGRDLVVSAASTTSVDGGDTAPMVDPGRFVALVVAESMLRLVCLGYGVRRALSAESRNRIGYEMRREVKRSRKRRRRQMRAARRVVSRGSPTRRAASATGESDAA